MKLSWRVTGKSFDKRPGANRTLSNFESDRFLRVKLCLFRSVERGEEIENFPAFVEQNRLTISRFHGSDVETRARTEGK